jgi:hypothetical protein
MMKKIYFPLFLLILFLSCKQEYKQCSFSAQDEQLLIYNQILNELVEQYFYLEYLGEEGHKVFEKYGYFKDSTEIVKELINLQNEVYQNPSKFCSIILDTGSFYNPFDNPTLFQESPEIAAVIRKISKADRSVVDSLSSLQTNYIPENFSLCTSKVISLEQEKEEKERCYIGKVKLSKLFLNVARDKGLVFYEILRGHYGKAELLEIEKNNNKWKIIRSHLFWIS